MALTEVWWRGANGEWTRTTAEEADKEFDYSISVNSHMFRCYKCFQYVTFVKGTNYVSCHFKHSRGDTNKDCEDRSIGSSYAYQQQIPLNEFPLKLQMDGSRATIYIGLPPLGCDELDKLSKNNASLAITSGQYSPAIYRIDPSRFIPNTTNWFSVSLTALSNLSILIKPERIVPKIWKLPKPAISREGALFDARTGKRICEKGDVQVGKEYYLLRNRYNSLYIRGNDISSQSFSQDGNWIVYKLRALRMTDSASEFFFDELHMRLTQEPSDIDVVWPPVVQDSDVIETGWPRLWVSVHGEQDMQAYPSSGNNILSIARITPIQKVYEIRNSGSLQMICAERYSQTLQCRYIRPSMSRMVQSPGEVQITDGENREITETELNKLPAGKILRFLSPVDGSVTVSDQDGFCYRKPLAANQETRITDLRMGYRITVRQSCTVTCEINIAQPKQVSTLFDNVPEWKGRPIPFPSKYAYILEKIPRQTALYQRLLGAFQRGMIPEDGWNYLRKL